MFLSPEKGLAQMELSQAIEELKALAETFGHHRKFYVVDGAGSMWPVVGFAVRKTDQHEPEPNISTVAAVIDCKEIASDIEEETLKRIVRFMSAPEFQEWMQNYEISSHQADLKGYDWWKGIH